MEAVKDLMPEALKNLSELQKSTKTFDDIILHCFECAGEIVVKYSNASYYWYEQALKEKYGICKECRDKKEKKISRIKNLYGKRLDIRKCFLKIKEELGIKSRFINCSFENYKSGINYKSYMTITNKTENILLYGPPGCGKSHLACAYMSVRLWHGIKTVFITTAELLMKIRTSFKDGSDTTEEELIEKYSKIPILILDDIGVEKTTEWVLQTLYLIIDGRYSDQRQTVFTSNLSPTEIAEKLGDRMSSRICSGKIIKIASPDYRLKKG